MFSLQMLREDRPVRHVYVHVSSLVPCGDFEWQWQSKAYWRCCATIFHEFGLRGLIRVAVSQ